MARARRPSSSEIEMSESDVLHVLKHGTVIAREPLKREPGTPAVQGRLPLVADARSSRQRRTAARGKKGRKR